MREKACQDEPTFALTADVSEAHRKIPIHPCDRHLLGCQVLAGEHVYIHTVGTFGVASASYDWSWVSGTLGRHTQKIAGNRARAWHMVVAADYHLESGGQEYRTDLVAFFVLCSVVGVPLSWAKDSRRRLCYMGWLGAPPSKPTPWNIAATCRVVRQVGTRDRNSRDSAHGQVRGGGRSYHVRGWCPGA